MINKIKQVLKINTYFDKLARNTYDSSATILLHKFFPANTVLSFTPFSLNPNTILHIINEIQINNRKNIIEFGSGISTIILAKFIKDNNLNTKIVSIEDNKGWYDYIKSELIKYDLDEIVSLNYIPLLEEEGITCWYNKKNVLEVILNKKFDLILVDGPSGGLVRNAREPALEVILNSLNESFIIFLDDIRRKDEREIINNWESLLNKNNYKINKQINPSKVYGIISCGEAFSSTPLSH